MIQKSNLLPALFLLAGTAGLFALNQAVEQAEMQRIMRETEITRDQVALRIRSCVNSRAAVVDSLATLPWSSRTQLERDWALHAGTLHALYGSILALNFVDPDRIIRIVYPEDGNSSALGFDLNNHASPSVTAAIAAAERGDAQARSTILELLQGGSGFALYQRISATDGNPLGIANGVFRVAPLMQSCLGEEPLRDRFTLTLSEPDGSVFWQLPESGAALVPTYGSSTSFDVLGQPWSLQFSPTADWLESQTTPFDRVWNALGLALVASLALLLRSLMREHGKLQQRESQYRLLVENQSDFVVQVNAAGEFIYASPSYCRLVGKQEDDLRGQRYQHYVHEDDLALVEQSLATLQRPPHTCYHEQRAPSREGWRWLAWSNSAVLDAGGNIVSITAVGRDVTELRQLQARASHAEKMQALGNLAGGISHDFNNILHVVLANIEFLKLDHVDDGKLQAELDTICHTLERAVALVGRLASLSRQDPVHKESLNINPFVDEVLMLLRRTLPPSISLQFRPAPQPLFVKADKGQLVQVLLNLCFNARDAISGNGSIRLTLEESSPPQPPGEGAPSGRRFACIRVRDDGSGIPPDILPRIFEPFFTTKPHGSGTGLGLANCHGIVKQHGGEIVVDSWPGKGSEFRVYLPLVDTTTDVNVRGDLAAPSAGPQRPASPDQRNVLLIVDDDPEILRLTAALLRNAGYEIRLATNGEEALALVAEQHARIRLVLMDVLMPILGGLEAAERLQASHPELPVLLMSGYVPDGRPATVSPPLLRKPFTREQLLQAIAACLAAETA